MSIDRNCDINQNGQSEHFNRTHINILGILGLQFQSVGRIIHSTSTQQLPTYDSDDESSILNEDS